ncbi:MAG: hypothetical protein A2Y28_02710 [Chlamydiae bacterium GWC2_50_10]|nr:MAG: hypothetical protein A2Z85_04515 [Chlamydiae bacterium GWA2_50_15]OGN54763.1 MAG: hypothetical protein A2Y28_02710 [Chlamydiae bacterium GWC2_50_10]OGN54998.1 MAG: hypothetical protein A2098_02470 [Chlamydiae bacterium GWF2_49_8]OGN58732.1 MAG: hypothetical protein A3D18_03830 [Chlamydiae bacterium RIFCSPHIGHO2_02_FULL_49_29]OGN64354.1 MAG: hypothetical protein A3E26_03115 [Chlamydiae bacterium RIFCSPHIGHO2_12_FULL_49_32]OGN71522.1 MAG: hypothetical protein A3G30_03790 [Chlamydiae bact
MKRFWNAYPSREAAEAAWEEGAKKHASSHPLKKLPSQPNIVGITRMTRRFLKLKSIAYLLTHDKEHLFLRAFLKRPLRYAFSYIKSVLKRKVTLRQGSFYLYGLKELSDFKESIARKDSLLIVGFSFCHKPRECPTERFHSACLFDPGHAVCRQCFIAKVKNFLPEERVLSFMIPTVYDIGKKILDTLKENPHRKILFLITACELSLEMFGDFAHALDIQGIGIRLDGRICNTFKAFTLAERGIKPGFTSLSEEAKSAILDLIK